MSYRLAIDIGASSGRHILGEYSNGKVTTTEIYRFDNYIKNADGTLIWDIEHLTKSVIEGLKKCNELGKIPQTVAIDTWGVDYVLLDKNKKVILPAVSYRDARTIGIPDEVDKIIPETELFLKTGIQRQNFNTVYQLFCDAKSGKLDNAEYLLLIPEYLSFKLTGNIKSEYTISSTTSLLNAKTRDWDMEIISALGYKKSLFGNICFPGEIVGEFTEEIKNYAGFDSKVVFAPAHDTASAVAACSLNANEMFISSGTWSLIGILSDEPILSEEANKAGFSNEGGTNSRYRFLKNIMGMWLFQSIKKNLESKYSYDEMMQLAMNSEFCEIFNPNDQRLVAPENMITAIRECLNKPDLPLCDVINSAYHSIATSYSEALKEIERITKQEITQINIFGGGSKDTYLNDLTRKYTGKKVVIGTTEATATGNLLTQFLTSL